MDSQSIGWLGALIGTETGIVKGVNLLSGDVANFGSERLCKANKPVAMCLCRTSQESPLICVATDNGFLKIYDVTKNSVEEIGMLHSCGTSNADDAIIGLGMINGSYVTGESGGYIKVFSTPTDISMQVNAGSGLCKMIQANKQPHLLSTGGLGNDLKVWDVASNDPNKPVFSAKNVRHDWLNLQVPVHILGISFLSDERKIATGTSYHQIRLYDMSCNQRRPVMDIDHGDCPYTSIVSISDQNSVIAGTSQGHLFRFDLRKGRVVQSYKGIGGSVIGLQCHTSQPYIISASLDRFLRVHELSSKLPYRKVYLKSRPSVLLGTDGPIDPVKTEESDAAIQSGHVTEQDQSAERTGDEFWAQLPTVGDKSDNGTERLRNSAQTPATVTVCETSEYNLTKNITTTDRVVKSSDSFWETKCAPSAKKRCW